MGNGNRGDDSAGEGFFRSDDQNLFQAAIDSVDEAIHVVDSDLVFRVFNAAFRRWCRDLKIDTSQLVARSIFDVFPFLPAKARDEYRQVFDTGKGIVTEEQVDLNGRRLMTQTTKVPIRTDGRISHVVTIVRDITGRRRAEEKLRASEEKYRLLVENSPQGIIIFQGEKMAYANPVVSKITGYSPDEIMGMSLDDIVSKAHPDDIDDLRNRILDRISGKNLNLPYRVRIRDNAGRIRWIESYSNLITYRGKEAMQAVLHDITEIMEAENTVRASEEKYRSVVENSLQGIVILQDERIVFVNKAVTNITGRTREELLALSPQAFSSTIHPDDEQEATRRVRGRSDGKVYPQPNITRVYNKKGEVRWLESNAALIEYEGKPAVLGAFVDVTERRQAEEALQKSEEALRAQFQSIPIPTFIWEFRDGDFVLINFNQAAVEITEGGAEEYKGEKAAELYQDRPEFVKDMRECFENRTTIKREYKYKLRSTNKERYFNAEFAFVTANQILIHTEDITERKQAEEALRESEGKYRLLVENVNAHIVVADYEGRFIFANEFAAREMGIESQDLIGKSHWDIFPKDSADFQMRIVRRVIKTRQPARTEAQTCIRGERRWFDVNVQPYKNQSDKVNAALVIASDITERKRTEEELRNARDELEARVRQRTGELANALDELRVERETLEQKNIALKELIYRIETREENMARQIQANVDRVVKPILRSMKTKYQEAGGHLVEILETNLADIISPFITKLESQYSGLTPREIEICNMVRSGMACKDIADSLNVSVNTILKQRSTIRRKLGIANKRVNLSSFLKSLK